MYFTVKTNPIKQFEIKGKENNGPAPSNDVAVPAARKKQRFRLVLTTPKTLELVTRKARQWLKALLEMLVSAADEIHQEKHLNIPELVENIIHHRFLS